MSQNEPDTAVSAEDVNLPVKRTDPDATLEERMTGNAYNNILPARYLRRDENGDLVETQEELYKRVAKNEALAEVVYESRKRDITITAEPWQVKENHSDREELVTEVFGPGVSLDDDDEVELTEQNINKFCYDNIVPELPADVKSHVESIKDEFHEQMSMLSFMPNSPTLMNAGDELQQLSACFVDSPSDDIVDIHQTAAEAAQVFQSGGGMGYGFWNLRPYGDAVGSTGGIASGPLTFMRTFDQLCATIAQGGKRRGAQMGVMKVSHPDIIYFIHAKNKDVSLCEALLLNDPDDYTHSDYGDALAEARDLIDEDGRVPKHLRNAVEGHLSNFNISVGVTNDFMEALKNGEDYTLVNPRTEEPHIATEETKEMWGWFDLGEYVEVGEPLEVPAEILWERMVEGAHENGEPGVIYLERVNEMHSFDVSKEENSEYEMLATNPCGEQPLMEYEACNLGHINLSTLVSEESDERDWRVWHDKHGDEYDSLEDAVDAYLDEALNMEDFNHRIDIGTRFLENVVTMSDFPIDKIEETVANNRKIGLGIMGLAQMYVQMGIKYGTEEANEVARQVMTHINHEAKATSRELAEERGSFANWEDSKYADPTSYPEWFEHHVGEDPEDWEDGYPIRNHNVTTIAPTGTTSMLGNTSGGCEPIFSVAYYKNVSEDVQGDEMLVEFDDYFLRTLEANDIDVEAAKREAQEQMENNEFDGVEGLETVPDAIGEVFVVTSDLDAKDHAGVQVACQAGVDSAISKTVNAPNDSTIEDAKESFEYIYDEGGKGVTYYRDGTRSKQVLTTRADNKEAADDIDWEAKFVELLEDGEIDLADIAEQAGISLAREADRNALQPRDRASAIPGVTQKISTGYGDVYVTVSEDEDGLFEVFARIGKSGGYTQSFTEGLARLVSLALRSGLPPERVIDQLEGIRSPKIDWDEGEQVHSVPDAIATAMRRHIEGDFKSDQATLSDIDTETEPVTDAADADTATAKQDVVKTLDAESAEKTGEDAAEQLLEDGNAPECPECGNVQSLAYQEGCLKCITDIGGCGWSKC